MMASYASLSLAIYSLGIPLSLFVLLFRWRRVLNPPGYEDETRAIKARLKHKDMLRDPITSFALHYKPRFWWYEVFTLGKRFALTSLVLAFPSLASTTIYTLIISFYTQILEREWSASLDGLTSALSNGLNIQIFLCVVYMMVGRGLDNLATPSTPPSVLTTARNDAATHPTTAPRRWLSNGPASRDHAPELGPTGV